MKTEFVRKIIILLVCAGLCIALVPSCDLLFGPDTQGTDGQDDGTGDGADDGTDDGTDDEDTGGISCADKFWGPFIRMDIDEDWYIGETAVYRGETPSAITAADNTTITTADFTVDEVTSDMVKITEGDSEYYLYRNGLQQSSFAGTVKQFEDDPSASSFSRGTTRALSLGGLGGIDVVVANTKNPSDAQTVTTSSDGSFSTTSTQSNTTYKITPLVTSDGTVVSVSEIEDYLDKLTSVEVKPENTGEDMGNIIVTETAYKFKASVGYDEPYLFADGNTYNISINIANVGTEESSAPIYTLTLDSGLTLESGSLSNNLQTIESGSYGTIDIGVSASAIVDAYEDKKITVQLEDYDGRVWEDTVTLRFHKNDKLTLNLVYDLSVIKGLVLTPNGTGIYFSDSISIPYLSSGYRLAFSGASANSESKYSFGINTAATDQMTLSGNAVSPSIFESNDSEAEAVDVFIYEKYDSYLRKNDMDFFSIRTTKLDTPIVHASTDVYTDKISLSWPAIDTAETYYVYRAESETGEYILLTESGITNAYYTDSDTSLVSDTAYWYKVRAENTSGSSAYSTAVSGSSSSSASTANVVPADSSTVNPYDKDITVTFGTEIDNTGLTLGGTLFDGMTLDTEYEVTWNTDYTAVTISAIDGWTAGSGQTLTLGCTDKAGNEASKSLTYTVNAPTISESPSDGTTISATEDSIICTFPWAMDIDTLNVTGSMLAGEPYNAVWNTDNTELTLTSTGQYVDESGWPAGPHSINISCLDNAGNSASTTLGYEIYVLTTLVDGYGGNADSDMVIDSNGNIHIVFLDAVDGQLRYLSYDAASRSWSTPHVIFGDDYDGLIVNPDIEVDNDGNLHLAYTDFDNANYESTCYYAYRGFSDTSWPETPETIETLNDGNSGSAGSALALDSTGKPIIAYFGKSDWSSSTYVGAIKYATSTGSSGSWTWTLNDTYPTNPDYRPNSSTIALDVDDSGYLHIVFHSFSSDTLDYATNAEGSWPNFAPTITGSWKDGSNNELYNDDAPLDIHIDGSGNAHVSSGNGCYATNISGSWVSEIRPSPYIYGAQFYEDYLTSCDLSMDANEKVHFSAHEVNGQDEILYARDYDGTDNSDGTASFDTVLEYSGEVITSGSVYENFGFQPEIQIDSNEMTHIIFGGNISNDATDRCLKYYSE